MKKIFYILSAAIVTLAACTKESDWKQDVLTPEEEIEAEGPKVLLTFSVPSEVRTRAMADKPDIKTMHVAVFNAAGFLREYAEAELTKPGDVNEGGINSLS